MVRPLRPHALVATLMVSGIGAALAGTAHAVPVTAADFFAACPGPIFVSQDTEISGKADVAGDCTVSVDAGFHLTLSKVKLTVGSFSIVGDAAPLTIEKSKLTSTGASGVTLDAETALTITDTKVIATSGGMNIPPGGNLLIDGSELSAPGMITIGGAKGLRNIVGSRVSSESTILIAPGGLPDFVPTVTTIDGSTLVAMDVLSLSGNSTYDIIGSQLEGHAAGAGIRFEHGGFDNPCHLTRSSFRAPQGSITVLASCHYMLEDAQFDALGDIHAAWGGTFSIIGSKLTSEEGNIRFNGGAVTAEGSKLDAASITFSHHDELAMTDTSLRARTGSIVSEGGSPMSFLGAKLTADGTDAAAVRLSGGSTRTLTDTKIKVKNGGVQALTHGTTTLSNVKLSSKSLQDMVFEGGVIDISDSKMSTLAAISVRSTGNVSIATSKLKTDAGVGLLVETASAAHSLLTESNVKGPQVAIRSFSNTIATGNTFAVDGTIELSSVTACTSAGNNPDVPCF